MPLNLIIIIVILILFIFLFIYVEPTLVKHKIKNGNEYGSARFATLNEIKNNFKKESVSRINEAGFPIWYSKKLNYIWFDKETPHWCLLGSTGSGKSVTSVIPMCSFIATSKTKRSVFITDPKSEIYNATSKMFEDNGYKVLTIDFRNPELSNKFNILEPIIKEYEKYIEYEELSNKTKNKQKKTEYNNISMSSFAETNRLITSLASMIMIEKVQQKDPFWNNSAKNLLEGLIGLFLEEYKLGNIGREKLTMTSIRKFQNSSMEENNFKKLKAYIETKEYGTKSKDSLTSIFSASDNTYKSITAVFGDKMAIFDDINIANVTCKSDFSFDLPGKEKTALYVIVPDEDKTYFTLVTIIVGLLYRELVKLANSTKNKKLPIQIDWLLDEFANCPPLADIEAIVSVSRSRGMRFQFFIQSFSQLENVYGKEVSQIILDNCGLVYLKTNTQATAEEISKRLGKKTIESGSVSQSISLTNYNGNKSTSLIGRDLLTPDEIKQLHYKTIIFPTVGYPIFRDTVLYNKFCCYKEGIVKRIPKALKQLNETYFTVEQLNYKTELEKKKELRNKKINKEELEFLEEQKKFEKEQLKPATDIVQKILKKYNCKLEFEEINEKTFASFTTDRKISNRDKLLLDNKINKEIFVVNINMNGKGNNVIEIHLKGFSNGIGQI